MKTNRIVTTTTRPTTDNGDLDALARRAPATDDLLQLADWLATNGPAHLSVIEQIELAEQLITRRRFLIGAGALGLGVITSCGADNEAGGAAEGVTRTFSHPLGDTEIPVNPQRVVVLQDQNLLAPLLEMGADNIVGSAGGTNADGDPIFRRTQGYDVSGIEVVGVVGEPNLELVASLQPDLIIGTQFEVNPESYDTLTQIAPTILVPTVYRPVTEILAELAALTGFEERYNELNQTYRDRVADVQQALGDPATILLSSLWFGEDAFRLRYTNVLRQVIADMGFALWPSHQRLYEPRETFDVSGMPSFSYEVLPEHDTDVIIWPVYDDNPAIGQPQESALWDQLNAVQKGQAFSFNGDVIDGTTFRGLNAGLDFFAESLTTQPVDTTWSEEQGLT